MRETIIQTWQNSPFIIDTGVLLPDHWYCMMNASKTKHRESTLWQWRFWEHLIRDKEDFIQHDVAECVYPMERGSDVTTRESSMDWSK